MDDLILRQDDIDRFNGVLSQFVRKGKVEIAILIHKDGHLLAFQGSNDSIDTSSLSALISANFSSTQAIAHILGEKEFRSQLHQGEDRNIFISVVDDNTYLAAVFTHETPVETVRVYVDEYTEELEKCLQRLYGNSIDSLYDEPFQQQYQPNTNPQLNQQPSKTQPPQSDSDSFEVALDKTIQMTAEELGIPSLSEAMNQHYDADYDNKPVPRVLPYTQRARNQVDPNQQPGAPTNQSAPAEQEHDDRARAEDETEVAYFDFEPGNDDSKAFRPLNSLNYAEFDEQYLRSKAHEVRTVQQKKHKESFFSKRSKKR